MCRQRAGALNSWALARAAPAPCPSEAVADMEEERRRRERQERRLERRRRRREQLLKEQRQRQQQEERREQRRQEEEEQRRRGQRLKQQQELRALRAEVAALRRRLEQGRPEADPVPDPDPTLRFCQEGPPPPAGPAESGSASEARLGRLESGVSFLSKLTGIRVTEYSLSRAELRGGAEDGPRILRKGRLAGHCRDVTFHLEFQLLEMQDEENPSAAITELNIILEPMEYSELSRFVARTEETRDLFRFFRSLHFFLQWCEYRKRTFQYFKEKHGAVVQLPGGPTGDSMGLQSPRVPGFELMVVWTVHIDEDGQVLPRLDLLTKVPEPALTLDSRKVVERAPRCFRTLLQLLGVEAAIEGLVRLLAPEE
ncbi:centromere protein P [Sminthopsis crassicaudata]|uniref:centromere protein P n=1 Tax=Sminthopsis crassicaudata TaxID=9301 RepID=UPI003D698847